MEYGLHTLLSLLLCMNIALLADEAATTSPQTNASSMFGIDTCLNTVGAAIHNCELPLVGKLGNILPFGVVSCCLQSFPGQTMVLAAGALLYVLYNNETVRDFLAQHDLIKRKQIVRVPSKNVELTDDFFVFDGEDVTDAEEEEDDEEEFLDDITKSKDISERKKDSVSFL